MTYEELLKEQKSLEEEIRQISVDRYFSQHEKAAEKGMYGDTHVGRNLLNIFLERFINAVVEWKEDKLVGRAGRRPRAALMLQQFGDDRAACYIFFKHLIHGIHTINHRSKTKHVSRTSLCMTTSRAIHEEFRLRYFQKNHVHLAKKIIKDHNERDLPRERRRELWRREFHKQKMDWEAEGWGAKDRLQLGLTMLEIFRDTTGLIEEYTTFIRKGLLRYHIQIAPQYVEEIAKQMERSAPMFTLFYPTVVPPVRWQNGALRRGGYYTSNVWPYALIKHSNSAFLSKMEERDLSPILDAVNALQETPWRVNMEIVSAVEYVFDNAIPTPGIPPRDLEDFPPTPPYFKKDGYEEETKDHMKERNMVRQRNRKNISKRLAVIRTITLGKKFSKYPAIYFPHDLDTRGRAYPKPTFLNPQGPDYAKSMLEFAEGKPIETEEHAAYLAVAIANAWGQDKLPLQERVNWVNDNEGMLLSVAENWREDLRWTQADEPFMALRGALEWAALASYGPGFVSHMPVHFDATCSGLQHFSALLRDAEGGFHVNLTASADRQDIYGAVAKKAQATIEALLEDEEQGELARVALDHGITRSLCKRPVMIVPYSGTFKAAMGYIEDYYKDLDVPLPVDPQYLVTKLVPFVTHHVWAAIGNTVIAAREAMDWITHAARLASAKGSTEPVYWTTPDGFECRQAVYDTTSETVNTFLDGRGRVQTRLNVQKKTLDTQKMAQSLSPNYIHSMDACHLRKSILRGLDIGISDFAMIHDSFGVHASEMPRFVEECIKPAFIEMYASGKNLDKFREELLVNIKANGKEEELNPLPAMGTLDINEVQHSEFFFS